MFGHLNSIIPKKEQWGIFYCYNNWSLVLGFWNHFRAIKVKWVCCVRTTITASLYEWNLFGKPLRLGAGGQGQPIKNRVGGPGFWFHPLISEEEESLDIGSYTSDQLFSLSCLCDEAFIKTQEENFGENWGTREHFSVPHAGSTLHRSKLLWWLSHLCDSSSVDLYHILPFRIHW